MKYTDTKIVFQEIPDEVTLAINISGCNVRCPDCHSKYLWKDTGESLDRDSLFNLINRNIGITCVAFMGGDYDISHLYYLFESIKSYYPNLKVAWYSGVDRILTKINSKYLTYIKVGPYISKRGPLSNPNTNQKLYKVHRTKYGSTILLDMTSRFWKRY